MAVFSAKASNLLPNPVFLIFLSTNSSSMVSAFSFPGTFILSYPAIQSCMFILWHCNSPHCVLYLYILSIDIFSQIWFEFFSISNIFSQICLFAMLGNVKTIYFFLILYPQAHRCIKDFQYYSLSLIHISEPTRLGMIS